MSEEQCIYYKFGYSSDNFLSIKNSLYTNSRLVYLDVIQEIQCDLVMKWMFLKERSRYTSNGRMIPLDRVIKNDIINMNDSGERWEGDSLNNLPYGFGSYYNSENQVIFNGFMFEGMKVCFGIEYYGDIGTVQYVGSYYYNTRCGYGKLYNKKNEIIYEGEWYNDRPITDTLKIMNTLKEEDVHFGLKEIILGNGCLSDNTVICLVDMNCLNKLVVGMKSLIDVTSLILKNLPNLTTVFIDDDSFSKGKSLSLSDLPNLETLEIRKNSFKQVSKFSLISIFTDELMNRSS